MYIQIDGANFLNKGAELMLAATVDRLRREEPECLPVWGGDYRASFEQTSAFGLYRVFALQRFKIPLHRIARLLRVRRLSSYGLVHEDDVSAVLDVSGFRYGDQWNHNREENCEFQRYYGRLHRQGCKVVFLPQAFGPFEMEHSRDAIKTVTEHASLIYAREQESLAHLEDCLGKDDRIRCAPDFTSLISGSVPAEVQPVATGAVGVIPNRQMHLRSQADQASEYFPFLVECIEEIRRRDVNVVVLNHEGNEDFLLCRELCEKCSLPEPITGLSALEIKGTIGCLKGLLSSRFHGAVSALSQAVPCLATSWSHKYPLLFEDYGIENGVLELDRRDHLDVALGPLVELEAGSVFRQTLADAIPSLKAKAEAMWDDVLNTVRN